MRQSCEAVITAAGSSPSRRPRNSSQQEDSLVRLSEDWYYESNSLFENLVTNVMWKALGKRVL